MTKKKEDNEETSSPKNTEDIINEIEDPILNKKFISEFVTHLRAAVPALVVDVRDRKQFVMDVDFACKELDFNLVQWNADSGLTHIPPGTVLERPVGNPQETQHPYAALQLVKAIAYGAEKKFASFSERTVFAFRNFEECWHGMAWGPGRSFAVVEMIINCLQVFKNKTCSFLFYGSSLTVPNGLSDDVQRLEYPLPGRDALLSKFKHIEESAEVSRPGLPRASDDIVDKSILSTQGLTASKAEQAYALSLIKNDFVYNEKA